jgi:hypothetical protein
VEEPAFDQIHVDHDKDKALEKVAHIMKISGKVIFTDASAKGSSLGAAAVMLDQAEHPRRTWQAGFGSARHWTVHSAELVALYKAVEMAQSENVDDTT